MGHMQPDKSFKSYLKRSTERGREREREGENPLRTEQQPKKIKGEQCEDPQAAVVVGVVVAAVVGVVVAVVVGGKEKPQKTLEYCSKAAIQQRSRKL